MQLRGSSLLQMANFDVFVGSVRRLGALTEGIKLARRLSLPVLPPSRMGLRGTAIGWALGVGRLGGDGACALALSACLGPRAVFLVFVTSALVSALVMTALVVRADPVEEVVHQSGDELVGDRLVRDE